MCTVTYFVIHGTSVGATLLGLLLAYNKPTDLHTGTCNPEWVSTKRQSVCLKDLEYTSDIYL